MHANGSRAIPPASVTAYRLISPDGWRTGWHTDEVFVDWLVAHANTLDEWTLEARTFHSAEDMQHANCRCGA